MSERITIQFWNDLICPMCPIGNVRLKQGIERFAHKDKVEIVYRSFRLRPGVPPHTVKEYLEGNHGNGTDVPKLLAQVEQWGADAGLVYKMANTLAGDAFRQEVEADEKTVRQMGIGGVPFFLLNDQVPVRGIQSPEHFLSALNQAWQTK